MAKYILGLELGDSNIKLLECKKHRQELMIRKVKKLRAPHGAISDGVIWDVEAVYRAIYDHIRKEKYKAKTMVVVIKSSQSLTRHIKMKQMPRKDLEAILDLQYQDHLLVDTDQYQVRYKKIERIWESNKEDQDLLIAALPNIIINPLIELARKLTMKVRAIHIASDVITHFFIKEEDVIVVDISEDVTNIGIISSGYGILNRVIPFGSSCEKQLFIRELGSEVQKLFKFYGPRSQNNRIERIHIIGQTQGFKEIDQEITRALGVCCQLGIDLSLGPFRESGKIDYQDECFANVIGLIGEFCNKKTASTNMVPDQYKKSLRRRWSLCLAGGGISLGLAGLSVLATIPTRQIMAMEKEQLELEAKLSSGLLVEVKNITTQINAAKEEKDAIRTSLDKLNTSSHISKKTMDIILSNAPGGLAINKISMDRFLNTVLIDGHAKEIPGVAQYMVSLYNTNQFTDITYTTKQSKEATIEYKMEIRLKSFNYDEEIKDEDLDMDGEDDW